jgi:mercuric ion binding protein
MRMSVFAIAAVATLAVAAFLVTASAKKQEHHTQIAAQTQTNSRHTQVVTLKVPDMFCGGCEVGVKTAAQRVDGVTDVKTDFDARTAEVSYDPSKTNSDAIAGAINKTSGFKVLTSKTKT